MGGSQLSWGGGPGGVCGPGAGFGGPGGGFFRLSSGSGLPLLLLSLKPPPGPPKPAPGPENHHQDLPSQDTYDPPPLLFRATQY